MIKTNKPTNTETDNNLPVSKYLRSSMRKIMSKKLFKTILLILTLTFFNVGAKYPAMSEVTSKSPVDSYTEKINSEARNEAEKYMKMYEEIYQRSVIQQIEFESEVIIPNRIDFKYVEYAYEVSKKMGIAPRITFRLMFKESSFDHTAISRVGAKGLMQLMPDTRAKYYKDFRVDTLRLDRNQEDIYIGICYLMDLQEFWRGRGNSEKNLLKLSLAAYNAGTVPVMKYKGVPPYKETQDFVTFILKPHSNPVFYSSIVQKNSKKDLT